MTFANLSGGRDSTAMVVRALELGIAIDYILFCDLGFEFQAMYQYLENLNAYLKEKFGKEITRIDTRKEFLDWAFVKPITKGEHQGKLRGLPKQVGMSYCTREGKVNPSKAFVKKHGSPNAFKNKALIGYTFGEVNRGRTTTLDYAVAEYPLHAWGWNEAECEAFLKERGIANPLYKHFKRTGCFFCPHQSKQSLYNLYKHYRTEWEVSKGLEDNAKAKGCINQTFKADKSLAEYQKEFETLKEASFDFEYENNEICFCK